MKKNLVGMLKNSFFRRMIFVATFFVLALASSSCKHDKGGDNAPFLTSVKVDSNVLTVQDVMDAGITIEEEVNVEFTTNPSDASLSFEPNSLIKEYDASKKTGKWALKLGEQSLRIIVKKGQATKEYRLKITREPDESEGLLSSITIGPHKKKGQGIVKHDASNEKIIEIPVPTEWNGTEYPINIAIKDENARIEYEVDNRKYPNLKNNLENGKIVFAKPESQKDLIKEFGIKVSKDGEISEYKVKVIMMTNAIGVFGSRYMGRDTSADHETIAKVRRHEKDIIMEISGESASIAFASEIAEWETILYNGEDAKLDLPAGHHFKALGRKDMPLTLGQNYEIEVILSNSEWDKANQRPKKPWLATEKFKLNILSNIDKKADAFINRVLVNGKDITNEEVDEDAFTDLFRATPIEIESGTKAKIVVELVKKVAKVKIQDQEIGENEQKAGTNQVGDNIYRAKVENIAVESGGTLVEIVVSPKAEDPNYRETIMKFKLVYKKQPGFYPIYFDINDKEYYSIPNTFKDALIEGSNPPYTVDVNNLGMRFFFDQKPKKVTMKIGDDETSCEGDKILKVKDSYGETIYVVNIARAVDTSKKQVTLTFEPSDEGAFSKGEWKFEITGVANKPKLIPKFEEISKDTNLSDDFLNKLTNNGGAEYSVVGTSADLLISLSEYEHDFLLEKIMINGVDATKQEFMLHKTQGPIFWQLKKTIDGLNDSGKDVTIKFEAKAGVADSVEWKFKLKSGGQKPSVPKDMIRFGVAGYGSNGTPFTDEFLDGIRNKSYPILELYGKDVKIYFETFSSDYLKEAKFQLDGGEVVSVPSRLVAQNTIVEYTFQNLTTAEHTIVATVVPNSNEYSELEYKFKVKILEELPIPETYVFGIDGTTKPNGYKATLNKDFAFLVFQVKEDVVEEVRMGKGASLQDSDKVVITNFKDQQGDTVYQALKEIDLATSEEEWTIEVKSKKPTEYAPIAKCTYKLTGTAVDENNAAFIQENNKPKVYAKNHFKEGMEGKYIDDYGVESLDFTAHTMSRESKVKAIRVHMLKGFDMQDDVEKEFTREGNSRKLTGKVDAYSDKPTMIKVWCVGKDGRTKDNIYGLYKLRINPLPLFWSYKNMPNVGNAEKAYDEIEVSLAKIKKNRVYMIFAPWQEGFGFRVDKEAVSEGQEPLEYLGSYGRYQDIYKTWLDVTGMSSGETKEIQCKLVHIDTDKEAMVYKVKVKIID